MAALLGIIGTILIIARAWPQVLDACKDCNVEGVSLPTWAMTLSNNTAWLTLGAMIGAPEMIFSNVCSALGASAVVIATQRARGNTRWIVVFGAIAATAAAVSGAASLGTTSLTVLANCASVVMFLPQLYTVFKSSAVGVSVTTWAIGAVSSAVWVSYAFALGRPSLAACHTVIMPASIAIALKAMRDSNECAPSAQAVEAA